MFLPFLYAPAVLVATWSAAAFVYATQPTRTANRLLAIVLFNEGVGWSAPRWGPYHFPLAAYYGFDGVETVSDIVAPGLYLLFLGAALQTPLTNFLRHRVAQVLIAALTAANLASFVIWPHLFRRVPGEEYPVGHATSITLAGIVYVYAFAAAVSAIWVAQRGSVARSRAKAYALAFGFRDAVLAPFLLSFIGGAEVQRAYVGWVDIPIFIEVIFVALLTYSILRFQLFDIDLKLRLTISRGTLVTIYGIAFVVVEQVVQNLFSAAWGIGIGALATASLLLVFSPIRRFAEKAGRVTMPHVEDSSEYLTHRKGEVYKAALEEILVDGKVTPKEEALLARLRGQLEISPAFANALENDVRRLVPGPS